MRRTSARLALLAALVLLSFGLLSGLLSSPAGAVGVEVYRTDSSGNRTGRVIGVGNTSYPAYCSGGGISTVRLGVKVCY
jgi:hypothetical protein